MDTGKTGGVDPIDARLRREAAPDRLRATDVLLRTRAALGLQPLTAPALVFVPLGFVLGPQGLGLLGAAAIVHLDPVITLALAALGIFAGLELELRSAGDRRLLAIAGLEALTTMTVVLAATLFLLGHWGLQMDAGAGLVALMLGVAASVSSAGAPDGTADSAHHTATRIADLDDGLAIVVGAMAVTAVHQSGAADMARIVGLTAFVGVLAAVAGWLLFERAHSRAEQGVFILGTLALVGGAADYLRGSPLFAGMVAGIAWRLLPGRADQLIRADLNRFQHPLVLLLLVIAGALVDLTPAAMWLLAPFVVFRLAGKVIGAWLGARLAPPLRAADLAAYLLPPGLLGIALVLNFVQATASPTATAVATAVAVGTLAAEVLALVALPPHAGD